MHDLASIRLLYVEDEPELREHVSYSLKLHCDSVMTASNGKEALEIARRNRPDLVMSDIRMPIMDGLELTAHLRKEFPELPVILCTAFTDTDYLLKAIELGVAAYLPKPIDTTRMMEAIRQAAQPILQRSEIKRLKVEAIQARGLVTDTNAAMKRLEEQLVNAAESDFAVVIQGEPGTGKSAAAELLHRMSERRSKPFLTIDCRNRPPEQLEAELFGSSSNRGPRKNTSSYGVLQAMHGGTLLLDAPELLPLPLQNRILRLLEEAAYVPTGSIESIPCNVRIVTVTACDLADESAASRFNSQLWLRLSEVVLTVPPLRSRIDDIPILCRTFLAQAADELGRPVPQLTEDAILRLQKEPWPGNTRQLKQLMRRIIFLTGDLITSEELTAQLAMPAAKRTPAPELPPSLRLSDLEDWAIQQALIITNGKKMQAAELLDISYNAFKDKLRRSSR